MTDVPLMNAICACGYFPGSANFPISQDVSSTYFSKLGDNHQLCSYIAPAMFSRQMEREEVDQSQADEETESMEVL